MRTAASREAWALRWVTMITMGSSICSLQISMTTTTRYTTTTGTALLRMFLMQQTLLPKFFDYDNDGWVDLLVVNGHVYPQLPTYKQRNLVHHNNRDGTFSEVGAQLGAPFAEKRTGRGAAFGDIDNDGDVDVIINNLDGAPQLLRNDGGNTNNSVLIKTIGVKSNRDGIGARVTIVSGDLRQVEDVHSGGSYISQNDLRLHFGLETRTKIDLIEVRWPSGAVDKITGASANKILTIKEGQGIVSQKEFNRGVR